MLRNAIEERDTSVPTDKSRRLVAVDQSMDNRQLPTPRDSQSHEFTTVNTPLNHSGVTDRQTRLCRGQAPLVRHQWSIASDQYVARTAIDRLFSSDLRFIFSLIAAVAMHWWLDPFSFEC